MSEGRLPAHQVLVTVGTPTTLAATGGTLTTRGLVNGTPDTILHAAFDAGLLELELQPDQSFIARWPDGRRALVDDVTRRHGQMLRSAMGIRSDDRFRNTDVDIAAALPHDLGGAGLSRLTGFGYDSVRNSAFRDMHIVFTDDARMRLSTQSHMFAYTGVGALAALPEPLADLLDAPYDLRVAAGAAFGGLDAAATLHSPGHSVGRPDRFASRLSNTLATHGPALLTTLLSPALPLNRYRRDPSAAANLVDANQRNRVPQAPMNSSAACASALCALADLAPQMLLEYPGHHRPKLAIWASADAATLPAWEVVEAFGVGALATTAKLAVLNDGRSPHELRGVEWAVAPFDVDACGTVVGDGASAVLVTTLDFAMKHHLDVTSIIVGWGNSGETGGKAHFAGVGFGGENAAISALAMAAAAHGYGVNDFGYLAAHATGTRANSATELSAIRSARRLASHTDGKLTPMSVGAAKSIGDGHTMGDTGLKSVAQAIEYVLGRSAVGLPALRRTDPDLAALADDYVLASGPASGTLDSGAVCTAQGFGGYNAAIALRSANPDTISRYQCDQRVRDAYLERWAAARFEREMREHRYRSTNGASIRLAEHHRWPAAG